MLVEGNTMYPIYYTDQKGTPRCGGKGTLLHCWWECKLVQPLWRKVWRFLKNTKNRVAVRSSNPTPGHVSRKKTIIQKDTCTPMFIAAPFTIAKTRKQPKCPLTDEWIKMWYIYTMENYSAIKRMK